MTFQAKASLAAIKTAYSRAIRILPAAIIAGASLAGAALWLHGRSGPATDELVMLPTAPPPVYAQSGKISDRLPSPITVWLNGDVAPVQATLARLQVVTRPEQTATQIPSMFRMEAVFGIRSIEETLAIASGPAARPNLQNAAQPRKIIATKPVPQGPQPMQLARLAPRAPTKPIVVAGAPQTSPASAGAEVSARATRDLGSSMTIIMARGASAVMSAVTRAGGAAADLIGLSGQS